LVDVPKIDADGDGVIDMPDAPPVSLKITVGADGTVKAVTQTVTVDPPTPSEEAPVEKAVESVVRLSWCASRVLDRGWIYFDGVFFDFKLTCNFQAEAAKAQEPVVSPPAETKSEPETSSTVAETSKVEESKVVEESPAPIVAEKSIETPKEEAKVESTSEPVVEKSIELEAPKEESKEEALPTPVIAEKSIKSEALKDEGKVEKSSAPVIEKTIEPETAKEEPKSEIAESTIPVVKKSIELEAVKDEAKTEELVQPTSVKHEIKAEELSDKATVLVNGSKEVAEPKSIKEEVVVPQDAKPGETPSSTEAEKAAELDVKEDSKIEEPLIAESVATPVVRTLFWQP